MSSRSRRSESGYVAIMISIMIPTLFLGLAAVGVDTSRWYLEGERVQKAADAAALAGVPFLPQDMNSAKARAFTVAKRNGYDHAAPGINVSVERGDRDSQLKVTIASTIDNQFGQMIGVGQATIGRSAVADYTGPAPMGSPCNTFSNEPAAGVGSPASNTPGPAGSALGSDHYENCSSNPQFWATIEGPGTEKTWGDRYQTKNCNSLYYEESCESTNTEYNELGYFWVVKVDEDAVDTPIDLQLYDPAFVPTGKECEDVTASTGTGSGKWQQNMNPYVTTDGQSRYRGGIRYSSTGASFCTGDFLIPYFDGSTPQTTSFVLREQTDSQDPMQGAPISGCTKQFAGTSSTPSPQRLRSTDGQYNKHMARVFHNWFSLCTFTPTREGDYYLQVRSNVSAGGNSSSNTNGNAKIIYDGTSAASAATGNTSSGYGVNSFAIRAVPSTTGLEGDIAVSAFDRMPIYANGTSTTSTFNLIRVLPGAAGQFISFSFYDISDIGDPGALGTVTVLPPEDATGTIESTPFPGSCRAAGAGAGSGVVLGSSCAAPVSNNNNNGRVETMSIPVPADYDCDYESFGGCWYQVRVSLSGVVNDITTWDAQIVGDPVRLVE